MRKDGAVDRLTNFARQMRKQPSEAEQKLWQSLRNRQLQGLKFRRQFPVGPFVTDFGCEECRLIVEVDGEQHADAMDYDERRTLKINELGWQVIRFTASDVVRDLDAVLVTILRDALPRRSE